MVNPWVGPFEALTEQVDADWGGVWALVSTSCWALEVVQQRASCAEDDWVLNLSGYFIVSATTPTAHHLPGQESPLEILDRRFASGELDVAAYQARRGADRRPW